MNTAIFTLLFVCLAVLCVPVIIWWVKEEWNNPGMGGEKFLKMCRKNQGK